MKIRAIKTEKIVPGKLSLLKLLDKYVHDLSEGSILAVTSKVVAICEERVFRIEDASKDELVKSEADLYLPKEENSFGVYITIKNNLLAASAGIDESNTGGHFVLWPSNPQNTANGIRIYLKNKFNLKKFGVIVTDSKTTPLRWGVIGVGIAHSGFSAINNLVGTPDIFGRNLKMTKVAVMDALSVSAVLVMGEGNEQTPMALITDIPFVKFRNGNPTRKELADLAIPLPEDIYAPLLKSVRWRKGK